MSKIYLFHNINPKPKNMWEVTPDDLMKIVNEIKLKDISETEIHFDDARIGVYKYAYNLLKDFIPLLKVTVFVPTEWIDGYVPENEKYSKFMNWEQLATLRDAGFEIGSHSVTHRNLTTLPAKIMKIELRHSKQTLKKKLNLPSVNKFSYPYGAYTKQLICKVQKSYCQGYILGPANIKKHKLTPIKRYEDFIIPRITMISKSV